MRKSLILLTCLFITGCATLTDRGATINVVSQASHELVQDCKRLGSVFGNSDNGGLVGKDQAMTDVRNKAGEYNEADTLAITRYTKNWFSTQIAGFAYNCRERNNQYANNNDSPSEKISKNVFEKAKQCQAKGGVWVNDLCVIDLN